MKKMKFHNLFATVFVFFALLPKTVFSIEELQGGQFVNLWSTDDFINVPEDTTNNESFWKWLTGPGFNPSDDVKYDVDVFYVEFKTQNPHGEQVKVSEWFGSDEDINRYPLIAAVWPSSGIIGLKDIANPYKIITKSETKQNQKLIKLWKSQIENSENSIKSKEMKLRMKMSMMLVYLAYKKSPKSMNLQKDITTMFLHLREWQNKTDENSDYKLKGSLLDLLRKDVSTFKIHLKKMLKEVELKSSKQKPKNLFFEEPSLHLSLLSHDRDMLEKADGYLNNHS